MSYPTTPEFSAINVESVINNISSEARNGRIQVRGTGGQKWKFTARYNDLTRAEFSPVYAFVNAQNGRLNTFDVTPPVIGSTQGDATGTMSANGAHSIGDSTINVDGFTGTIKAGDFVKFASHNKVYMVTADVTGAGSLAITPTLVEAVADDEVITYNDVPFKMRLDNDVQSFGLRGFDRYSFEVDFIEVI